MIAAIDTFTRDARMLNGSLSAYELDGDKKTLFRKATMKADKNRLLMLEENGSNRFVSAELYRQSGDIKQGLFLAYDGRGKKPRLMKEQYKQPGDDNPQFPIETARVFAYEAPSTLALCPIPQQRYTFPDLLDYPAVRVTAIEHFKKDNVPLVKISFHVDDAINKQQPDNLVVEGIVKGWVSFRPDQMWTIDQSEVTLLKFERRKPAREVTWNAEYIYSASSGAFPILKEVRLATILVKEAPDQKMVKLLYEMDFKPVEGNLSSESFSLKQFDIPERTIEDWKAEEQERARLEAEENAKIAKLSPEQLKPASAGLNIDPWVWLVGGLVVFVLIMQWVFLATSRKAVRNSVAGSTSATLR